jgi:hypothetical protein
MICLRDVAGFLAAAFMISCSPLVDTGNTPDAAVDTAPMITVANPAASSRRALVTQPITVFFDEQLDPASVNATTVRLGADDSAWTPNFTADFFRSSGAIGTPLTFVRGTVALGGSGNSITFTPSRPLAHAKNYVLLVDVADMEGNTTPQSLRFSTFLNLPTRFVDFEAGLIQRYFAFSPDSNGLPAKRVRFSGAGTDTDWFNADDVADQHVALSLDATGRLVSEAEMAAGEDQKLNSPDDTISVYYSYVYTTEGRQHERIRATGIGMDNMWGSPDDEISLLAVHDYVGDQLSGYTVYNSPGTDTEWRNDNDHCEAYWEYSYDGAGRKVREIFKMCGTDMRPRTPDDEFVRVTDYTYDQQGELVQVGGRTGPGADAAWLTEDDIYSFISKQVRDADGLVTHTYSYSARGDDLLWNTPDDVIGGLVRYTYDSRQLLVRTVSYVGPGTDPSWDSGDEVVGSYTTTTYDTLGNKVDRKTYVLGPDRMPFTPDDQVIIDEDFDVTN